MKKEQAIVLQIGKVWHNLNVIQTISFNLVLQKVIALMLSQVLKTKKLVKMVQQ